MGHPEVRNDTPFVFEPLFLCDEQLRPVLTCVLKCSFRLQPIEAGALIPLAEQLPLNHAGTWTGEPGQSSLCYEPEVTPYKRGTDVVLLGEAVPPRPGLRCVDAGVRVGQVSQRVRVFGRRFWYRSLSGRIQVSDTAEVQRVPLTYENAFGGVDRTVTTSVGHPFEDRNPVGMGYHHKKARVAELDLLPLIENPLQLIDSFHATPAPAGFGFVAPHWQPRAALAGTYDAHWEASRKPLLPMDFNPRFHNSGSSGLVVDGYLQGNESVTLLNVGLGEQAHCNLPGLAAPSFEVEQPAMMSAGSPKGTSRQHGCLDTVIIDTNQMLVILIYRSMFTLQRGVHGVRRINVSMAQVQSDRMRVV